MANDESTEVPGTPVGRPGARNLIRAAGVRDLTPEHSSPVAAGSDVVCIAFPQGRPVQHQPAESAQAGTGTELPGLPVASSAGHNVKAGTSDVATPPPATLRVAGGDSPKTGPALVACTHPEAPKGPAGTDRQEPAARAGVRPPALPALRRW